MKKFIILLAILVIGVIGMAWCENKIYKNVVWEGDSGSIRFDGSVDDFGAMITFWDKGAKKENASLQLSGMRELHNFYVYYLNEKGEIKDEKLKELKKRMEAL